MLVIYLTWACFQRSTKREKNKQLDQDFSSLLVDRVSFILNESQLEQRGASLSPKWYFKRGKNVLAKKNNIKKEIMNNLK
jgi:hypothetical protein